jgi:glycosyltransferase involved in cell wall biosynthesis
MRIEILLSTYNGEKYLPELLDSLLGQEYEDCHITARDDGSSDSTAAILKTYSEKAPEKISVLPTGQGLGYPDCFWTLLEKAPKADLYAFCDQDDVWNSRKLACCAEMCEGKMDRPLLYVHDYRICDRDLNPYGEYHMAEHGYEPGSPLGLEYFVMTSGFTMVLNEAMRERVLRDGLKGRKIEHDRWLFWCGYFGGEIVYDRRTLVDYRRHDATASQTGKSAKILLAEWWREDVRGSRMNRWSRTARYFADCYREEMKEKDPGLEAQWRLVAGEKRGPGGYFGRLFFPARLKPSASGEAVLRLCFLLNRK